MSPSHGARVCLAVTLSVLLSPGQSPQSSFGLLQGIHSVDKYPFSLGKTEEHAVSFSLCAPTPAPCQVTADNQSASYSGNSHSDTGLKAEGANILYC